MNKVILCGNITRDLELKKTQSNKSVVNFGIALNEGKDQTTFIDCQAWEKTADLISTFFSKGSKILLEGRLATYKKEGEFTRTYVVVERVEFVESKKVEKKEEKSLNFQPDDLPFF